MSEIRIKFLILYIVAVLSAYVTKWGVTRVATKAIKDRKLSTGIYRLFPIEGETAVELAKGYIRGVNVIFWFIVLFFPLLFLWSLLEGTI